MSDPRELKYVLGEKLPPRIIGNLNSLSKLITKLIGERLLSLNIKKNVIISNDDILKVINDIYNAYPYITPEQIRKDAVGVIVNQTVDSYENIDKNFGYDINVIQYTGECGIVAHGPIKVKEKRRPFGHMWIY